MLYTTIFVVIFALLVIVQVALVSRARTWLAVHRSDSWSKSTPLKKVGDALSRGEITRENPELANWGRIARLLRVAHWLLVPLLLVAIFLDLVGGAS